MSSVEAVDVFEELSEENKRLLNELQFADNCLKALIEFRTFCELLFKTFKYNFTVEDQIKYEELVDKVEEAFTEPANEESISDPKEEAFFKCNICDKKFRLSQNIRRHLRNLHKKSTENLTDFFTRTAKKKKSKRKKMAEVDCDICHNRFRSRGGLITHRLYIHKISEYETTTNDTTPQSSLDEPKTVYGCTLCTLRFNVLTTVKRHLRNQHQKFDNITNYFTKHSNEPIAGPSEVVNGGEVIGRISEAVNQSSETVVMVDNVLISSQTEVITAEQATDGHDFRIEVQNKNNEESIEMKSQANRSSINQSREETTRGREEADNRRDAVQSMVANNQSVAEEQTNNNIETNVIPKKQNSCDICLKAFVNKSTLFKHIRNVHNIHSDDEENGEKSPFKCKICEREFKKKSHLKNHRRYHSIYDKNKNQNRGNIANKPFECSLCGTRFRLSESLRIHLTRIHRKMNHFIEYIIKHNKPEKREGIEEKRKKKTKKETVIVEPDELSSTGSRRPKLFRCKLCTYKAENSSCVKRHLKKKHKLINNLERRIIEDDNYDEEDREELRLEKPFECKVCEYRASKAFRIRDHIKRKHKLSNNVNLLVRDERQLIIDGKVLTEGEVIEGEQDQKDDDDCDESQPLNPLLTKRLLKPYVCKLCSFRERMACHVRRHLRETHRKFLNTDQELNGLIKDKRKSKRSVEELMKEEEMYETRLKSKDETQVECDACDLNFSTISALEEHKQGSTRRRSRRFMEVSVIV